MLELEEESGSPHLLPLLEKIRDITKEPDICICMDTGALDYESLWLTSSLRGNCAGNLKVEVLQPNKGAHSGLDGGIVPESFRIAQQLLDRLEDPETRRVNEAFQLPVPAQKIEEAKEIAESQGTKPYSDFALVEGLQLMSDDLCELYLN